MQRNSEESTIDLLELLTVLLRRVWIIILCAILGGGGSFLYTYFAVEPTYRSNALFYVNNSGIDIGGTSVSISSGQISTARSLVDTYIVVLNSIPTLQAVVEESGLNISYETLAGMISASAVNETEIFRVTVTAHDPQQAKLLTNTIASVLPGRLNEIIKGSDVSVVQYAVLPSHRSSPSYSRNTMMGALIGAAVAVAGILVFYFLDEVIHTEDFLATNFPEIPLLAVIPDVNETRRRRGRRSYYKSYYKGYYKSGRSYQAAPSAEGTAAADAKKSSAEGKKTKALAKAADTVAERTTKKAVLSPKSSFAVTEAYKLLRTNLSFSFTGAHECHVIGVTSALRGEGKSTVSINTAYTIAEAGKRVILVDADMRLSNLAKRLGLRLQPGLSDLLAELNVVSDAMQQYVITSKDGSTVSMDVIVAGNVPPNPSELLGSERMENLIGMLRQRYDYIVIDLPPVTEVTDALVVSRLTDGFMLIVRHDISLRGALQDTIRQIDLVNGKVAGFVYNAALEGGVNLNKYGSYRRGNYRRYGYYRRGYYRRNGYGYYQQGGDKNPSGGAR